MSTTSTLISAAHDELLESLQYLSSYLEKSGLWESEVWKEKYTDETERAAQKRAVLVGRVKLLTLGLDLKAVIENSFPDASSSKHRSKLLKLEKACLTVAANRAEYELQLNATTKPSTARTMTSYYKPMQASAIDKSEPREWTGQRDSRQVTEVYEDAERFVTLTKGVEPAHVTKETTRMILALVKGVEKKTVEKSFDVWRLTQENPADAWPSKELMCKWMTESLTSPKSVADLLREFHQVKQLKKGLPAFHAYITKFTTEYQRLTDHASATGESIISVFNAKVQFKDNMDPTARKLVSKETDDKRLIDHTESLTDWLEAVRSKVVLKLQSESDEPDDAFSKKQRAKEIKEAVVRALKHHQGKRDRDAPGGKNNKKAKLSKKQKRAAAVLAENTGQKGQGAAKAGADVRGKPKWMNIQSVPADWKSKVCTLCGVLGHSHGQCWHNPSNKDGKKPYATLTAAELGELKQRRATFYATLPTK